MFFEGILPGKLTCPMKINGWKMHFQLKYSFFEGHVSFPGHIRLYYGIIHYHYPLGNYDIPSRAAPLKMIFLFSQGGIC